MSSKPNLKLEVLIIIKAAQKYCKTLYCPYKILQSKVQYSKVKYFVHLFVNLHQIPIVFALPKNVFRYVKTASKVLDRREID